MIAKREVFGGIVELESLKQMGIISYNHLMHHTDFLVFAHIHVTCVPTATKFHLLLSPKLHQFQVPRMQSEQK